MAFHVTGLQNFCLLYPFVWHMDSLKEQMVNFGSLQKVFVLLPYEHSNSKGNQVETSFASLDWETLDNWSEPCWIRPKVDLV